MNPRSGDKSRRTVTWLTGFFLSGCAAIAQASHDPPPIADPIPALIPTGPFTVELAEVASFVDFPTDVESPPDDSGRLFVTLVGGIVQIIEDGTILPTPFLDLSTTISNATGALSAIAFHPNFATAGDPGEDKFYTVYQEPPGSGVAHYGDAANAVHQSVVYEWEVSAADANIADPNTKREILRVNEQVRVHNLNDLAFGPLGYLYLSKGDDDANVNSILDGTTIHGTILRIDIDDTSGNGRYSIPTDNPFAGNADGILEEVFAYGFRNPWRISFDKLTGELYVADVGEDDIEEINIVEPRGYYGWIEKEGSFAFLNFNGVTDDLTDLPADFAGIDPVAEYDHTEGDRSITGGFVYRGNLIPSLNGHYVFSDLATGRLMHLDPVTQTIAEIAIDTAGDPGSPGVIGFGETADGELLIVYANTQFGPTMSRITAIVSGSGPGVDTDSDGVDDDVDNCIEIPNGPDIPDAGGASQLDTNGDGFGNACDPDLNNDNVVDFGDLPALQTSFFSEQGDEGFNADADTNGDGVVDFGDLPTYQLLFFGAPGPSGLAP